MTQWISRLGIRTRLFLAFGAIAGSTVVASIAACLLFSQVGGLMNDVAQHNIPEVIATLELAAQTEGLAGSAPALLGAETTEQRANRLQTIKVLQDGVAKRLEMVADFKGGQDGIKELAGLNKALNGKLAALDAGVGARLTLADQRGKATRAAQQSHAQVIGALAPAMEKTQGDITMVSMTIGGDANASTMTLLKLVSTTVPLVQAQAELAASSNLAAGVLARAALAPSADAVEALRKEFAAAAEQIDEKLAIAEALQSSTGLAAAMGAFLGRGTDKENLFELRTKELAAQAAGQKLLEETRAATQALNAEVTRQVETVRVATKAATDRSDAAIGFGSLVMVAIAAASMVGAGLIVWLYIGRSLVRRITGLEGVMTRLAAGDLEAEVRESRQNDEIGQMAKALAVFRDGLVRANALAAEQAKEQEAKQKRATALEALTEGFNQQAAAALAAVAMATGDMHSTAETMSSVAQQATDQTAAVASASTEAAANVQTVAAATEELSSSVAEIGRQVTESSRIADQAVQQVSRSQATVTELSEAAQKIGEVVGLINTIAGQTNLLALNATIEAARAGEAGKGFAVVASEVKNLANQTAQATENITAQVAAIQTSTGDAVKTMKEIGEIIGRIAEIATTIAAAVEEQGAATQEIARNVQEAAAGTQQVSTHIAGVSEVAGQTGESAAAVLAATERLTKESELLRGQVDSFLAGIKAA